MGKITVSTETGIVTEHGTTLSGPESLMPDKTEGSSFGHAHCKLDSIENETRVHIKIEESSFFLRVNHAFASMANVSP